MNTPLVPNVALSQYTTLKVGGPAEYFTEVDSLESLQEVVQYAQQHRMPITIIGGGSNMLIADDGVKGVVIRMTIGGLSHTTEGVQVFLTAGAGLSLDEVVEYSVENAFWGLENLSHIPGTVGAAPVQNVGAYGVEVKDVIESVHVYNTDTQQFQSLTTTECLFGYRDSLFKKKEGKKYIVVAVTFRLSTEAVPNVQYKDLHARFADTRPSIRQVRDAVIEIRAQKFPDWTTVGTAGSFFKNPVVTRDTFNTLTARYPELPGFDVGEGMVKLPLGWILDKVLHIKGEDVGRVGLYKRQALVLVNNGGATAQDIVIFAHAIEQKVYQETQIQIQWEVTKVGVGM